MQNMMKYLISLLILPVFFAACSMIPPSFGPGLDVQNNHYRYVLGTHRSGKAILATNISRATTSILACPNPDEEHLSSPRFSLDESMIYYACVLKSDGNSKATTHIRGFAPTADYNNREILFDFPLPAYMYHDRGFARISILYAENEKIYFRLFHGTDSQEGIYVLNIKTREVENLIKGNYARSGIACSEVIDANHLLVHLFDSSLTILNLSTAQDQPLVIDTGSALTFSLSPSKKVLAIVDMEDGNLCFYDFEARKKQFELDILKESTCPMFQIVDDRYMVFSAGYFSWWSLLDFTFMLPRDSGFLYDYKWKRRRKIGPPMNYYQVFDLPVTQALEHQIKKR